MKSTKIIATIGPASDSVPVLTKLKEAGMDVARLNFSHGDLDYFKNAIDNIKKVNRDTAILLDTAGPEIRTGKVQEGVVLKQGCKIMLTDKVLVSDGSILTVNYNKLMTLAKGQILAIDDGNLELKITKVDKECLEAEVIEGGELGSTKGVSIPDHRIEMPVLTRKDRKLLKQFAGVADFVAASFVRNQKDIREMRKFLPDHIMIISKIEHWEAIHHLDEIINESDGVMIARGDLGVEITLEKVPRIQAEIIKKCNELGKPVIVATQMLESMRKNPHPTRAEVSDVSLAILQGADAIMLSGETTVGKHPVGAVRMMTRIAKEYDKRIVTKVLHKGENNPAVFVAESAYHASEKLGIAAILTPTESGYTARNVSRFKPKVPILAMTPNESVFRQLNLSWGVVPVCVARKHHNFTEMINQLVNECCRMKCIERNDLVVLTGGHKLRTIGSTNILEISSVQDIIRRKRY